MRTTVDLDEPVLREAKELAKQEGKSLGQLISELLAVALRRRESGEGESAERPKWVARQMGARVDLSDREALYGAMEERSWNRRVPEER